MTDRPGIPARELTDEELERQGVHAHAMRHWVFLHGTAEQFRTHTERMLELEQEYAGPGVTWPAPFKAGSRRPQTGRSEGPRPRLELVRHGEARTRHARWRPGSAATG